MSLINKVLQDLDSRHAAKEQKALPNEVRPLPPAKSDRSGATVLIPIALLAAVVGAVAWATWDSSAAPVATPIPAPVAATPSVVETPPPPILVITPPDPPLETLAAAPAAEKIPAQESQVSSLRLATALKPEAPTAAASAAVTATAPVPVSTAPASIDKRVRVDAHERAEAAYRKATSDHRQGRTTEAAERLHEALREEPGHGPARQLMLSLLVERQQWPEAETLLREGLELTPSHSPWAMALARIQVERGQSNQAWETLQKYMFAGETNADYQGFAGVLLQRQQKPAEAIAHYQAALRLKPEARWWAGLGLALEAAGHSNEAREAFQRAQETGGLTPEMAAVVERRLK